jgi:hypothetical protein
MSWPAILRPCLFCDGVTNRFGPGHGVWEGCICPRCYVLWTKGAGIHVWVTTKGPGGRVTKTWLTPDGALVVRNEELE